MSLATLTKIPVFNGHKKHLVHLLAPYEKKFLKAVSPRVPSSISTVHLTLMTVLWSAVVIYAGYLARNDIRWLWLFNGAIVMQYVTDMLDGEVGRTRDSGLIKWGFYMDHFLDYIFLSSIIMGYSFLLPPSYLFLTLLCLTFTAGFMVHTLMDFSITNNFKISCNLFGVSETRCVLMLFNILLMILGRGLLIQIFPFFVMAAFAGLCSLVFSSQKVYRHIDTLQQARRDEARQ